MSTTPSTKMFLTYGSLRATSKRGYNRDRMGPQRHIRTFRLDGYALTSLGSYPAAFVSEGDSIIVELHEVSEQTLDRLTLMEEGAGYQTVELDVAEGKATIYLMDANRLKGREKILNGDWF